MSQMTLGKYLVALRHGKYTQRELAKKAGMHWITIGRIEATMTKAYVPSDRIISKLINALDLDAEEERSLIELWLKLRFGKSYRLVRE